MPGRNTTIPLCELAVGSMFMAYRYAFDQEVPDNYIGCHSWKKKRSLPGSRFASDDRHGHESGAPSVPCTCAHDRLGVCVLFPPFPTVGSKQDAVFAGVDLAPCTQEFDVNLATLHIIFSGDDELHKLLFDSGTSYIHNCWKGCF